MNSHADKSDAALQEEVLRELRWGQRIDDASVSVEVRAGIVTLTGALDSWAKHRAAQNAAHSVRGVQGVVNEIVVRTPGSPGHLDAAITDAVRHALLWDVCVPDGAITFTVHEEWVTLSGRLESWAQHDAVVAHIAQIAHVRGVIDHIGVTPARVFPGDVRCAIEAALERWAEREAGRITIDVDDGRVTLSGTVNSWEEKQTVLGAAKKATGVRAVDDRLQVEIAVS